MTSERVQVSKRDTWMVCINEETKMSHRQTQIAGVKTVELYAVLECLYHLLVASRTYQ